MTREEAINNLESLYNEVYNEDSDGHDCLAAHGVPDGVQSLRVRAAQPQANSTAVGNQRKYVGLAILKGKTHDGTQNQRI